LDFRLNEDQESMVKFVKSFAEKELLPKYSYWDKHEEFPKEQFDKMANLGLTGLRISEKYGGQEADCLMAGLVAEQIARGDFSCGYAILLSCLLGDIIERFATDAVKKVWLPNMVKGQVVCLALTEPQCGSDASAIKCKAEKRGDTYYLTGEKSSISMVMAGDAAVVFAKTDPSAGARGISAFLVPLDDSIERTAYEDMGEKAIVRGSIFLDNHPVPAENLIGNEGGGFIQVMQAFDYSRVIIALMCVGAAQISLEETIEYTKTRETFGKPLAKNQAIAFTLAEYMAKMDLIRWYCYQALWRRDVGLPHTKEAAITKWLGPETAARALHECLLIHGHYGYTKEYPIEQRLRDIIGLEIGDGTANVQKFILCREYIGREFRPY
jgi:cyclohexanecarboxyl-CoA dehydrogenase